MDMSKLRDQIILLRGMAMGLEWVMQEAQKESTQKNESSNNMKVEKENAA